MVDLTRAEIESMSTCVWLYGTAGPAKAQQAITQLLAQLDATEATIAADHLERAKAMQMLDELEADVVIFRDAANARADAAAGQMREIITLAKRAVDQDKSIARERGWNEIDIAKRFANQDTVIRCAESALPLASPKRGEALHKEPTI